MAPSTSSSSLVLRCFAPPFLAEAWRQAVAPTGDHRDQLGTRMGFVECAMRYLVAVLSTEVAGLGAAGEVGEFHHLLTKLPSNHSWGDWSKAAGALAKRALQERDRCVVPELAEVLYSAHRKGPKPTAAQQALRRLVELRNGIAHQPNGSLLVSEAEAKRHLDASRADLRTLVEALRVLRRYPLYCCISVRRKQGRGRVASILHLTGTDFETSQVPVTGGFDVPEGVPFLVSPSSGSVLLLAPFVVCGHSADRHEYTVRLLSGTFEHRTQPHRLLYIDGLRREATPFEVEDESDWLPVANLSKRSADHARIDAALSDAEREALHTHHDMPDTVGPYTVEALLGQGASGSVYRATDAEGRVRALKLLKRAVLADPQFRRRLRDEYAAMASLESPHVATVYAYEEDPDVGPYLVMECVEGTDLDARVARDPLSADAAAEVALAVLQALASAHARDVIHRDVKPANIMVDALGHVKLLDFGVATAEWLAGMTRSVDAVGTTAFAAPEQLEGGLVDGRADLYAMGRTLEFLLQGRVGGQAGLVDGLRAVVRKATQANPAHRWGNAREMAEALRERMDAGWGGAPVHEGGVLNQSYELRELLAVTDDGFWAFDAVEIATQAPISVLLGRTDQEPSLASLAMEWLVGEGIDSGAYPGVHRTDDGLEFAAFPPQAEEDPESFPSFVSRRTQPGAAPGYRPLRTPPTVATPLTLLGRAPADATVFQLREAVERVMDLVDQMATVAKGRAPRAPHPGQHLIRPVTRRQVDRITRIQRPVGLDRAGAYAALRQRRNAHAHGAEPADRPEETDWRLLEEYIEDAVLLADAIEWSALHPVVLDHPTLGWSILDFKRADYRALDLVGLGRGPVPDAVGEQVSPLLQGGVGISSSGSARLARQHEGIVEHRVAAQLENWALSGGVQQQVRIDGKNHRSVADLVVQGKDGSPLAVVEVKANLGSAARSAEQVLWKQARLLGTQFAALTDGTVTRWFQVDEKEGLSELDEQPKTLKRPGQRRLFDPDEDEG